MVNVTTYDIYKLPVWIRYFYYTKQFRKLSEILTGGSSYVLADSLQKKFKIYEINGDTKQNQYYGYNIFNKETATINNYISASTGEMLFGNNVSASDYIELGTATNIIMSGDTEIRTNGGAFYDNSKTYISGFTTAEFLAGLSIPNNAVYLRATITTNLIDSTQIEYGSVKHGFEPYVGGIASPNEQYEQPIQNVVGNIENVISNRNIIDVANPDGSNGGAVASLSGNILTISTTTTSSTPYTVYRFNSIKVGDIIRIKGNIKNSNGRITLRKYENGTWKNQKIQNYTDGVTPITIEYSVVEGITALAVYIYANNEIPSEPSESKYEDVIMTINTTDMTYIPHVEQNLPFTLAEGERLYKDSKLQDDGKHHERTQIVLDGTENWEVESETAYIELTNAKGKNNINTLCNYFIYTSVTNNTYGYIKFGSINKNLLFYKSITEKGSLDNWKAFLAQLYANGTPVIVEYELEEEQIVPYNTTQQTQYNAIKNAKTYEGTTVVQVTSEELPPILNIQYWQSKNAENRSINPFDFIVHDNIGDNLNEIRENETEVAESETEVAESETEVAESGTEVAESEVLSNEESN